MDISFLNGTECQYSHHGNVYLARSLLHREPTVGTTLISRCARRGIVGGVPAFIGGGIFTLPVPFVDHILYRVSDEIRDDEGGNYPREPTKSRVDHRQEANNNSQDQQFPAKHSTVFHVSLFRFLTGRCCHLGRDSPRTETTEKETRL